MNMSVNSNFIVTMQGLSAVFNDDCDTLILQSPPLDHHQVKQRATL